MNATEVGFTLVILAICIAVKRIRDNRESARTRRGLEDIRRAQRRADRNLQKLTMDALRAMQKAASDDPTLTVKQLSQPYSRAIDGETVYERKEPDPR